MKKLKNSYPGHGARGEILKSKLAWSFQKQRVCPYWSYISDIFQQNVDFGDCVISV